MPDFVLIGKMCLPLGPYGRTILPVLCTDANVTTTEARHATALCSSERPQPARSLLEMGRFGRQGEPFAERDAANDGCPVSGHRGLRAIRALRRGEGFEGGLLGIDGHFSEIASGLKIDIRSPVDGPSLFVGRGLHGILSTFATATTSESGSPLFPTGCHKVKAPWDSGRRISGSDQANSVMEERNSGGSLGEVFPSRDWEDFTVWQT